MQVDETYIGGKKAGKRGRGAEGEVAVGITVEDKELHGIGSIRLEVLPYVSSKSLEGFINQSITPGSKVITDGWKSYASLLKRWMLCIYQGAVRRGCLPYYLDEFTFRFNHQTSTSRGKLFFRLVQYLLNVDPVPRASLVGMCKGDDDGKFDEDGTEPLDHNI